LKQEDVFPLLISAADSDVTILALHKGVHSVFPVHADLPTVFPAVGLYFSERGSKPRPGYDLFKYRDCDGELVAYIQNKTTARGATLMKTALDNLYINKGVTGTWGWKIVGEDNRIENQAKMQSIEHYKMITYNFHYTVTDI